MYISVAENAEIKTLFNVVDDEDAVKNVTSNVWNAGMV